MKENPQPPIETEVIEQNFQDQSKGKTEIFVGKLKRVALVGLLSLSSSVGFLSAQETLHPTVASADTIDDAIANYPNKTMPCEHSPYNVTGACANYDWGPTHTDNYNDPSELSSRGYAYRNCTDWVAYRLKQLTNYDVPNNLGDGGQWYDSASNSQKTLNPQAWDAAVEPTTYDSKGNITNYGHVAFIENISSDGKSMTISEYNHDELGNGDQRTIDIARSSFTEFVDFGVHPNGSNPVILNTAYPEGAFLKVNENGAIYRMAGGAPIRIYNQGAISDFKGSVTPISSDNLGKLPHYPNDGEFISIAEAGGSGIYEFVGGAPIRQFNWGVLPNFHGATAVNSQSLGTLDHMLARPKDGAVVNIQEAGGSGIYRFIGGAPIRLFNQGAIPNLGKAVNINSQSLGTLDHMNAKPADGSVANIVEAGGSGIYRYVGGAPIRLFNQGAIPNLPNAVGINSQSLGTLDHMNARPTDGSVINIVEAGGAGIYEFVGGAPVRLFNQGAVSGLHNAVGVNSQSLGALDHMNAVPANGEFIKAVETGTIYRAAGGASLKLYNAATLPDYFTPAVVNKLSIDNHDHMNITPNDGTVIEGVSSQTYWQINGGKRSPITATKNAIIVDEQTVNDIPSI
ncbi:MAG TPA: CHAP domain-containing protein [Candidatus Saccharimonadales bacterium]|nr:CHAP domain-containing protein [Candidatus Saccharimonadales bacterium]